MLITSAKPLSLCHIINIIMGVIFCHTHVPHLIQVRKLYGVCAARSSSSEYSTHHLWCVEVQQDSKWVHGKHGTSTTERAGMLTAPRGILSLQTRTCPECGSNSISGFTETQTTKEFYRIFSSSCYFPRLANCFYRKR